MESISSTQTCWCGNQELKEFSPNYSLCLECGTLVLTKGLTLDEVRIHDDEQGLYGKEYWMSHQTEDFGYPDIHQRSRQDLPERDLYWLHTLMKYYLPPAKVLEVGCAHGGSVALMKWAGFDAIGLELSPWVVEFAEKNFDIPILLGPIEDQLLQSKTFDVIVLYDVLEHLPNPYATMGIAASLLKEDGIFIIQTPNYQENKTYEVMVSQQDNFLSLMIPEHTYLFSHWSISEFCKRLGFDFLYFEPQLFDYDMYFVASRHPIVRNTDEQIAHNLLKCSSGRMILALLDQSHALNQLKIQYQSSEKDREQRLQVIEQQGEEIAELHSKLHTSLNELQQTQTQLTRYQSELQQTQTQLSEEKRQFQQFQLQKQQQLQQLQNQINETERQFEAANVEIAAMKTSKFWKLRTKWFKIKELGSSI
jgi:2-polyprenyl-3-methyl-5-hydroxy-6-metoxy-1,4-benzoquinol methylase